ncbi:glucan biosynthesis protein [Ruixingdingia sedimenti]|uniref:Glucan biosynthesis protein G n=1 Tax=Ruixingdingia sedimenti TaxID=3073604 RepID=A0ABU1F8M5_9RHOB|nr:glucan biosynthesis protein G [Xinfangfangia sp. LG-4]MDR5653217.1 glucan biosynthesis protein G [Xinfangfangia sp. LG-4]
MFAVSARSPMPGRRDLLKWTASLAALAAGGGGAGIARAQQAPAEDAAAQQFSFDQLTADMRAAAARAFEPAPRPEGFLGELGYDDYRQIRFRPDHARWQDPALRFRVHGFHMGWLYADPVRLFEVVDGRAQEMHFTTADFEYRNQLADRIPPDAELPGLAGFRLHHPLNRPDVMDELVAFLGASYFRAVGRGNAYGISARGLAINTATTAPEEFPRFTRFWLERPAPGAAHAVVHAALEGPSVTGAYRFIITPGAETVMEVTARLFFRADVVQLGVAPLTSMFLFAEKNRAGYDDYRPNVHDSNGLRIARADGDMLWRPLNNPPNLAGSYFAEASPRAFGLYQRDRDFDNYQDPEARYELRPSLQVEPLGDWGAGSVRLVEIPTGHEINDNIVAFWVPEAPVKAGEAREFAYRLRWGALAPDPAQTLAWVHETRSGQAGISGGTPNPGQRKFVIDFRGGILAQLPADADVKAVTSVLNGEIITTTMQRIAGTDIWRVVMDVAAKNGATVELGAHIAGYDRRLTETWLYQWINI